MLAYVTLLALPARFVSTGGTTGARNALRSSVDCFSQVDGITDWYKFTGDPYGFWYWADQVDDVVIGYC